MSSIKATILLAHCHLPIQLIGHYASFLHQMSGTAGMKVGRVMHNLLRTNETGCRYHPSNSLELKVRSLMEWKHDVYLYSYRWPDFFL